MKNKFLIIFLFVLFPLIVGLACTCGLLPIGGEKVKETEEQVLVAPSAVVVEELPTEEPTKAELPTEEETVTEEAQPVETDEALADSIENLVLLKENWGSNEEYVFVGFILSNQNEELSLTDIEYSIALLDSNGQEVINDWNTYPRLLPGENLGIFFQNPIVEGEPTVESVEITYSYEDTETSDRDASPFTTDKIMFWEGDLWPVVTGIINNIESIVYTDVRAGIILYNAAGDIVGGGTSYVDFIPGNDLMGFSTYVDAYDTVASVEVFPTITYSTEEYDDSVSLWERASILEYNFYADDYDFLYGGATIQNNLDKALNDAVLTVTFFDQDGYVTCYGTEYIDILLPGEQLGVAPYIYSQPKGASASDYTIVIFPGEPVDDYELTENVFVVNNAELTGDFNDYVKVNFTNTYTKQITDVDVFTLFYDSNDLIIGGGSMYFSEPIPAGASKDFEFYVTYDNEETVSRIEAWVLPNYWTEFE